MVNPKLPPKERKQTILEEISHSLATIAKNTSDGPMESKGLVNITPKIRERFEKQEEIERKEQEIEELKRSNKIAIETAKIATIGLILTAIFSLLTFILGIIQYRLDRNRYEEQISQAVMCFQQQDEAADQPDSL